MTRFLIFTLLSMLAIESKGQLKWINVDSLYQPLPASFHVYKTMDTLEGKPNIAFYISAELKDKQLEFSADTTFKRRLTPDEFYEKNRHPLLVVNCTFFSFETHQNLNTVIKEGLIVSHNNPIPGKGKDTFQYYHTFNSVLGITKKRRADVAWVYTDSSDKYAYALQTPLKGIKNGMPKISKTVVLSLASDTAFNMMPAKLRKWKIQTAIGGGPALLQEGEIKISNNEERKFGGKAIADKHPRTAMGYTNDGKLIILVVQGRMPGIAEGATLIQEAQILKDLGCQEALNLDGGGSSCMLINGKETIAPSDKKQRAVPAVFLIQKK